MDRRLHHILSNHHSFHFCFFKEIKLQLLQTNNAHSLYFINLLMRVCKILRGYQATQKVKHGVKS